MKSNFIINIIIILFLFVTNYVIVISTHIQRKQYSFFTSVLNIHVHFCTQILKYGDFIESDVLSVL